MEPVIVCDNFISSDDIDSIITEIDKLQDIKTQLIYEHGPFPNQLINEKILLSDNNLVRSLITKYLTKLLGDMSNYHVECIQYNVLYLPWDVHSDLYPKRPLEGYKPFYNFLIPLHDVESRTIVFDQMSDIYCNFSDYKKTNKPVKAPIDKEFWQNNLSMCWDKDRFYLTLHSVLPYQRKGQMIGFDRRYFHSSDNFHTRGITKKEFLQVLVDIKAE